MFLRKSSFFGFWLIFWRKFSIFLYHSYGDSSRRLECQPSPSQLQGESLACGFRWYSADQTYLGLALQRGMEQGMEVSLPVPGDQELSCWVESPAG